MEGIIAFYQQNKQMIDFVVVAIIYVITHRQTAFLKVKNMAKTYMMAAEKLATNTFLSSGPEKMAWVINQIINQLPGWIRIIVGNPDQVQKIVQEVFNVPKSIAELHKPQTSNESNQSDINKDNNKIST